MWSPSILYQSSRHRHPSTDTTSEWFRLWVHSHWYEYESRYPCTSSSKHEFACIPMWPFTLKLVLYELPVNFTCTSSFFTGRLFIQPVHTQWKQRKICINLYMTLRIFYVTNYVTVNYLLIGCAISKIINDVVAEYCYFFAKHSLDSI